MSGVVNTCLWWVVLGSTPSRHLPPSDRAFMLNSESAAFDSFADVADFVSGSKIGGVVWYDRCDGGGKTRAGWMDESGFLTAELGTEAHGDRLVGALTEEYGNALKVRTRHLHGEAVSATLWLVRPMKPMSPIASREKRIGTIEFGW